MVFQETDKNESVIVFNCNCGCDEEIHIKRFSGDDDYYLSIHESKFYSKQNGLFKTIKSRIKSAWRVLRGKDYLLCDLVLNKHEIKVLIEKLQEIQK